MLMPMTGRSLRSSGAGVGRDRRRAAGESRRPPKASKESLTRPPHRVSSTLQMVAKVCEW